MADDGSTRVTPELVEFIYKKREPTVTQAPSDKQIELAALLVEVEGMKAHNDQHPKELGYTNADFRDKADAIRKLKES